MAARRGDYGFDAPYAPALLAGAGVIALVLAVLTWGPAGRVVSGGWSSR